MPPPSGTEAALEDFRTFLAVRGLTLDAMVPRDGIDAALAFFRSQRFTEQVDDALLFQYGTYDWGEGRNFGIEIARELSSPPDADGNHETWHLNLTFQFAPTQELEALHQADRWCTSLAEMRAFEGFIRMSAPFRLLADVQPANVQLEFEDAR